ncbi:hypothetical protein EYB31_25795 [Paenibacillus thalictri]|uniref:Alpha-galactosidase NEW3 domain-containing protein n=2 Tax=Paenibacillus thalictri TaxID=2527873 RepID=A0A4Q9DMR7_9BACL|nr:hypothetical protein EYB31_25795 [Paenibacillus thalictri]
MINSRYGIVDLWKSIFPLSTVSSVMNTGAHPDDEHSDTLAFYSLGRGADTYSLIATRGEGGQNEIGGELGDALGVIRTRELQQASAVLNVTLRLLSEQIGDPICDFGFSKCAQETFDKWGERVVYERLIRHIRITRPDVVFTTFLNEPTTHGHHRAMTILTLRAFHDAADPAVFPAHYRAGLRPWQIKKMYVPADENDYTVFVPTGEYNEIYGASYVQLGEQSRFLHKSQGMGWHVEEGPNNNYYKLQLSTTPIVLKEEDFFTGIAVTFEDLAGEIDKLGGARQVVRGLRRIHGNVKRLLAQYPHFSKVAFEIQRMKTNVCASLSDIAHSRLSEAVKADLLHRLQVKLKQLETAGAEALSLIAKVKPGSNELVRGQTTQVTVTCFNGGIVPVQHVRVKLNAPAGWEVAATGETGFDKLVYNETRSAEYTVKVPDDAAYFDPYAEPVITADIEYEAFDTLGSIRIEPAQAIAVIPAFSVCLQPPSMILNTLQPAGPIPVKVTVRGDHPEACDANVSLLVPAGWKTEPKTHTLDFTFKGETKAVSFDVHPSSELTNGSYQLSVIAWNDKMESICRTQVIQYPHIGRSYWIQQSGLRIQAFDLKIREKLKVGYVSSGFDRIDEYLELIGVDVTKLEEKDIQFGDLSEYDTIVLGIRAYAFRPELTLCNERLLRYVENGGNLVVQYHKPEDNWKPELAPYPIEIREPFIEWRVTDEHSEVRVLAPDHSMFHDPNHITKADWDHWIQERAIYIPCAWSERYTPLISTGDAGEQPFDGIFLTARFGRGVYTYSTLVWYREIPNLVPGAIRMFANMISQTAAEGR